MKVIEKLFIARTFLALNQREAAEQAGIAQTIISLLERGEKKFIPTEYLQFLYNKGVDLNWLFNENNHSADIFRADVSTASHTTLPPAQENSLSSLIVKGMSISNEMEVKKVKHEYRFDMTPEFREILDELKKLNQNLEKHTLTNS